MEGPQVQLFVTCLVDAFYPDVGMSVVDILEELLADYYQQQFLVLILKE